MENNISKSSYVYELLKKSLDASSIRGKVIANNIANINTKDYKRYYVTFEENLKESMNNLELLGDSSAHIKKYGGYGDVKIKQDRSTSTRQDGNNVDIDNEMTNQAANTLMYNALVSQVNSRLSLEKYVINEGRR